MIIFLNDHDVLHWFVGILSFPAISVARLGRLVYIMMNVDCSILLLWSPNIARAADALYVYVGMIIHASSLYFLPMHYSYIYVGIISYSDALRYHVLHAGGYIGIIVFCRHDIFLKFSLTSFFA